MPGREPFTNYPGRQQFLPTRWTTVLNAARGGSHPQAAKAMAELCQIYWYPLYAFIRRQGHQTHEAEDLTQEFFARLIEKEYLEGVDPGKGKFRSFLLMALKRFLANEWDRKQAQKRGGGRAVFPLDAALADSRYGPEPADDLTPEKLYERQWALAVLEHVLAGLRDEYAADGKAALFDGCKGFLTAGEISKSQAEIAAELGMTDGAVKVAIHRLRRRYRERLRQEIADTVASAEEIDEEIQYLLRCL
jgi:RNA polymerase sigma factor (sigma-70 family)